MHDERGRRGLAPNVPKSHADPLERLLWSRKAMTNERCERTRRETMMMPSSGSVRRVRVATVASATFEPAMPIPRPARVRQKPIAMPAAKPGQDSSMNLSRIRPRGPRGYLLSSVHGVLFVLTMRLERKDDVTEHEEREHERLDEADEQLEPRNGSTKLGMKSTAASTDSTDLAAPDVLPQRRSAQLRCRKSSEKSSMNPTKIITPRRGPSLKP